MRVALAEQMEADDGPIVLINVFTVDPAHEEGLLKAWAHDLDFMKAQPGYISTQLHKGIAGSGSFVNYAIWQDVKSFRRAFTSPEFQRRIANYPDSAVAGRTCSGSWRYPIIASRDVGHVGEKHSKCLRLHRRHDPLAERVPDHRAARHGISCRRPDRTRTKAQVLRVHAPLVIAVLLLTLARIGWWWLADQKPDPVAGMPRWQLYSARAVHFLFYIVILGMAASGIGMFVLSGAGPTVFGGAEGQRPDFWNYKPRAPHAIGARVMLALLVLHTGAALYHHFIIRDSSLRRIWFGMAS
jgi:cytochrome b561/heme-degrading monooxygenase HmoA